LQLLGMSRETRMTCYAARLLSADDFFRRE
jgi:hypothetical protein